MIESNNNLQNNNISSNDQVINIVEERKIDVEEEELDNEYSVEEPEYKKLFQELFEIIHSVIPEDQSCYFNDGI